MNYKLKEYGNEIYEIENFISEDLCSHILSFVNLDGDEGWQNTHPGTTNSVMTEEKLKSFQETTYKLEKEISKLFLNATKCSSITNVRRLIEGEHMPMHEDLGYNLKDAILYGIVIYLNENFDGGELYYKNFNLKIKPKKNSMIIHKATNAHEVLTVTNGKRYCLSLFIYGDKGTKFKLK